MHILFMLPLLRKSDYRALEPAVGSPPPFPGYGGPVFTRIHIDTDTFRQ